MYRVWRVDEFQILLKGRNPRYSYMYKTRGMPSHDITLIKTKITARDGKRFILTFLRKNSRL